MTYLEWFQAHGKKHKAIMQKLSHLSDDEVIAYFRFENMLIKEPDFCLLYQTQSKCHDNANLNCYLCACPYFRFDDKGLSKVAEQTLFSLCSINARQGGQYINSTSIHHDCTSCFIPHTESYIKKHFKRDWFDMMRKVYSTS